MERLLKPEQVAERIGFSKPTVYRLIRTGRLRAVRMADTSPWRIPESAIDEFIADLETNQVPA